MTQLKSQIAEHTRHKTIEHGFPSSEVSLVAKRESWRKEVYRPPYYIHKWWARRLGSVFRAIILASCADIDENVEELFYSPARYPDMVIFDPFMGSGTTLGEALKLGCKVIGRDINPVAASLVTVALQTYNRSDVMRTYNQIREAAADRIKSFYKTKLPNGDVVDVLYYFWVKTIVCPECESDIDLFSNYIFSKHTYPKKHPEAKAVCPRCANINDVMYDDEEATCGGCGLVYHPGVGPMNRGEVTCPYCEARFKTIDMVKDMEHPLPSRMYAKMALNARGEKIYLPITNYDQQIYQQAEKALEQLYEYIPQTALEPGHNTQQVLNYHYTYWRQMFNDRQLASIAILIAEIKRIPSDDLRFLFAVLLSGVLEFNNMFCSFKGEGTGAVRHMFAHHILKPEFTPLEANLWGTPKSSGAFSTLFRRRIRKLLSYKSSPFELRLVENEKGNLKSRKVFGLSDPMEYSISTTYEDFQKSGSDVYISCGDSANTDIPDKSVDLVITDPPFFDNVHYSELADFFYVWLQQMLPYNPKFQEKTTRTSGEVQDTEEKRFAQKLEIVFRECNRVLKHHGLLIFTYHHTRVEGWSSVYKAVRAAGFYIVDAHPVKAEMAVSVPIQQAKTPVNFDLVLVCRKKASNGADAVSEFTSLPVCVQETKNSVRELRSASLKVSLGDIKVILMGKVLVNLAKLEDLDQEIEALYQIESKADQLVRQINAAPEANPSADRRSQNYQLFLLP